MKKIRRQFGAEFADALAQSPTLMKDLAEIRAAAVKIRKLSGRCQAYSNSRKMTISIAAECDLSYKLISLAHEKVHVLVSPTANPVPGKTSRRAFIDLCLEAETDAIEHEVQVTAELLAYGLKVDEHSLSWLRRYKRGGRAAIRKAIETSFTSNTGERYPEYYGGWYDEVVKPKERLPLTDAGEEGRRLIATCCGCPHRTAADCGPVARLGRDFCPRFRFSSCETPVRLNLPVVDRGNKQEGSQS
jgi:hypothetical protein